MIPFIYIEQSNTSKQKVKWWSPGAGGEGKIGTCLMGVEFEELFLKDLFI